MKDLPVSQKISHSEDCTALKKSQPCLVANGGALGCTRCRWRCKIQIYLSVCIRKTSTSAAVDAKSLLFQCDSMNLTWHVSVQEDHTSGFSQTNQTHPFPVLPAFNMHHMLLLTRNIISSFNLLSKGKKTVCCPLISDTS